MLLFQGKCSESSALSLSDAFSMFLAFGCFRNFENPPTGCGERRETLIFVELYVFGTREQTDRQADRQPDSRQKADRQQPNKQQPDRSNRTNNKQRGTEQINQQITNAQQNLLQY